MAAKLGGEEAREKGDRSRRHAAVARGGVKSEEGES